MIQTLLVQQSWNWCLEAIAKADHVHRHLQNWQLAWMTPRGVVGRLDWRPRRANKRVNKMVNYVHVAPWSHKAQASEQICELHIYIKVNKFVNCM
jgi:hypothetical protein